MSHQIPAAIVKHIKLNYSNDEQVMEALHKAEKSIGTTLANVTLGALSDLMFKACNYKPKAREVVDMFDQGKQELVYQTAKTYSERFRTFKNLRKFGEDAGLLTPYTKG